MKRLLLWGLVCCAACCGFGATTLNVLNFGATGSGRVDDSAAIARAVAELGRHSDAELFFPAGYYLIGTPNEAAMIFDDLTDVAVRFAANAVLVLDNQSSRSAPCHGIIVRGKAANISFEGITIQWKNPPAQPGDASGFVFDPNQEGDRIVNLRISNCNVINAPGDALRCVGVDRITVRSFAVNRAFGRGMSFSDCSDIDMLNVNIQGATETALFFGPHQTGEGYAHAPWRNRRVTIRHFEAGAGQGDGIVFSGVDEIFLDTVKIDERACGILIESGNGALPPAKADLSDLEVNACSGSGLALVCHEPDNPAARLIPARIRKASLNGCGNGNLLLSQADGAGIATLRANRGRIILDGVRRGVLNDLRLRNGCSFLAERVAGCGEASGGADGESGACGVSVDRLVIDRAGLTVSDSAGIRFTNATVADAPTRAVEIAHSSDLFFDGLKIVRPNRDNAADAIALKVDGGQRIVFDGFRMELDTRKVVPMYFAGGDIALNGELDAPGGRYELTELLQKPSPLAGDFPEVTMNLKATLGGDSFELHSP